jgi:ATP-dependent Lhr-like helicase
VILERFTDEIGDWRVCVLTPFGARVHAPWAIAVSRRLRDESDVEVDLVWSDDGIVFRLPEADAPPDADAFFPSPEEVEDLVVSELGGTSLFAARFRENAARSLLLPKKNPARRTPLWAQRRRSANLLQVAARHDGFPIVLETYRECLKDTFDLPGLQDVLREVRGRSIRVETVDSSTPSPFSASLLFSYVANFIYDGDAPLAERRAQILSIDHARLRELLGEAELRELLDPEVIEDEERRRQGLDHARRIRHADDLHDRLLELGDLAEPEIRERAAAPDEVDAWLAALASARRAVRLSIAGEPRWVAVEHAAAYRDALGAVLPGGLPESLLASRPDPLGELVGRFARTHGPFTSERAARRHGLGVAAIEAALARLAERDRVVEGEFLPGGRGREWCDAEVLRALKRRSLAKLRKEVEPVEPAQLGRFLPEWHGVDRPGRGLDAVLGAIEQLQGAPIPASVLESEILPARVQPYTVRDLDELCAAGEIVWRGVEPIGTTDGRIALYLTDHYPRLAPAATRAEGDLADAIRAALDARGALFFSDLVQATGAFPGDVLDALWRLVWSGEITNDTLAPLRSKLAGTGRDRRSRSPGRGARRSFRSRRLGPPGSEGRWTRLPPIDAPSSTERRTALAQQLLERHGVLTREAVAAEGVEGGFGAVYPVLKAMEESGKVRRGYFIAGLGATQFAVPGADDRLRRGATDRAPIDGDSDPDAARVLAATDPANPYGAALRWPEHDCGQPQRVPGALVVMWRGALVGYVGRTEKSILTFLPDADADRAHAAEALAGALADLVSRGGRRALLVSKIDGRTPGESPLSGYLERAGFGASSRGFLKRRELR